MDKEPMRKERSQSVNKLIKKDERIIFKLSFNHYYLHKFVVRFLYDIEVIRTMAPL